MNRINILDDGYECPVFTVTGDRALDHLIVEHLRAVLVELRQSLNTDEIVSLVLGGGYGRGEGGAFREGECFKPYNDYDLVLIHRVESSNLTNLLHKIHQVYSERFNIHVDITPIKHGSLGTLPHALTWYELYQGHQILYGKENSLETLANRKIDDLPETEWGRLLLNRGSGILFSLWTHQGKSCSVSQNEIFEQFATRQIEKAWLTLGDTWLASKNSYDTKVVKRREKWLAFSPELPDWSGNYLNAIDFKLNPVFKKSRYEIIDELSILAHLYSSLLTEKKASELRPVVGMYYTLKNISASRWFVSNPFCYPRERMRYALVHELLGYTLTRSRLIGSTEDYIQLWKIFG